MAVCSTCKMLRHREDWRCVLWIAIYFALTTVSWRYSLGLHSAALPPLVLLLCYFSFAGACITHNSMHCRTFASPTAEILWRHALSMTYGHPASSYVPGHNLSHHRYTQTRKDPMRTSKLNYRCNFLNALLFQPTVAADVFKMDVRYLALKHHTNDPYFQTCLSEWIVLGTSQIYLLLMDPYKFLLFVYMPHLFAQWAIVSINYAQHDGCDLAKDSVNGSRNFTGPYINYLTFNNGLHAVHHLHPTLHWSKLPSAHARLVSAQSHPNLNQPCMATYMFKAYVSPGKRVDYTGEPFEPPPPGQDEDWTLIHAPEGTELKEYDVSATDILKSMCLLPFKMLCPTYSPQFKVD